MTFAKLKTALPYLLSISALLAFIIYLYHNADQFKRLLNLSIAAFLLLCGLVMLITAVNGLINFVLYKRLAVVLTLNESIALAAVNTLANQLPFTGGMVAKGVYLKQKHKLAYTHFLSSTIALYVCFVAVNGVVGMTIIVYWMLVDKTTLPILLILGFLSMAGSIILLWLSIEIERLPDRWKNRLRQLAEGWQLLSQDQQLLWQLVGLQLLLTLIFATRYWIAFHMLSQEVSLLQCILFAAATILTRLVSITPGALGIREVIVATVAAVLGFEMDVSILAVGVDRLVATLVIIVMGTVYTYVLSRQVINASAPISES